MLFVNLFKLNKFHFMFILLFPFFCGVFGVFLVCWEHILWFCFRCPSGKLLLYAKRSGHYNRPTLFFCLLCTRSALRLF